MPKSILISGAGIAGPALAFWLARSRPYEVTVVEPAPTLRTGGHAVDYVLAGGLSRANKCSTSSSRPSDDHRSAFARYEKIISTDARTCQNTAESAFLAPNSPTALHLLSYPSAT